MGTSNGTVQPVGLVGLGLMGRGRVLLAGTYNGHPVPLAAAIATIYTRLEALGRRFENGFRSIAAGAMHLVRQGSAFCIYFMDHAPVDWHDIAMNHDFAADARMRRALIEKGVFVFPVATKQWSICAAHTEAMIDETLARVDEAIGRPVAHSVRT